MTEPATDFGEIRQLLKDAPCLSIRQPWAELIVLGRKKVELRRWSTRHRGWVWLHTGRTIDETASDRFELRVLFTGGFVGAFRLRDVVHLDAELWDAWRPAHLDLGAFVSDTFGWVISRTLRLQHPVAASGHQGLYRAEPSLLGRLLSERFVDEE